MSRHFVAGLARTVACAAIAGLVVACSPAPASAPPLSPTLPPPTPPPSSAVPSPSSPGSAPSASPPTVTSAPGASPAPTSSPRFALTSAAYGLDGTVPARFTCDGRDVSPAMGWSGTPAGTAWLVLIMDDPDAHGFTHWIAYAIPPGTTRLAENAGAPSSRIAQGTNDFGRVGYGGPCPPSGSHRYVFTLYALEAPLGLSGTPRASAIRAALAGARVLGTATLTARYARGG